MSFQLFWNSPLNKDTIISILASGIILRLQADSCTYHNKHISAHTDCAQNDMIFFIIIILNTGNHSFVFLFFIISDYKKTEFVVSSFSRYVSVQAQLDDMSSLFTFSLNFYHHFLLSSCCQKGNGVEISRVKMEALIWFRMVSTIQLWPPQALSALWFIYLFFQTIESLVHNQDSTQVHT